MAISTSADGHLQYSVLGNPYGPIQKLGVKSTFDFYKISPKVKRRLDPYIERLRLLHNSLCIKLPG